MVDRFRGAHTFGHHPHLCQNVAEPLAFGYFLAQRVVAAEVAGAGED